VSTSVADIAMDTVALKLLPTWTAICTFMGLPIWVQSQHRCSTAIGRWPCFGVYGVRGLSVAPLLRLTDALASAPGIAYRGLTAAVGSQFLTTSVGDATSHSDPARVRAFEPGASRAIYQGGRADHVGSDA